MTAAEQLLQQSRDFIARLMTLLDAEMQKSAAKDAEIAALKEALARAQSQTGIRLTDEEYAQLLRDIASGNAKLDEASRVLGL